VKLKPQSSVPDPDVLLDLQDPDPELYVRFRIRILPSTSKKIQKNLDLNCIATFNALLSLKTDVNVHTKAKENQGKKLNFC
jgi:hypothetical protein